MTKNAVQYAEEDLGVHDVFTQAMTAQQELEGVHHDLAQLTGRRLQLEDKIERREADLRSDERGKLSELSATAFEQHFKTARASDAELTAVRQELLTCRSTTALVEANIRILENRIRILTTRMTELGGYLNYLAAAKQAQGASK